MPRTGGTPLPLDEVELVRWPDDGERRDAAVRRGAPCMLLVRAGTTPPTLGPDEDWLRVPADERDLWARMQRLALRHDLRRQRPTVTDGVVLRLGGRAAIVSEGQGPLLRLLVAHFGRLVPWEDAREALWPGDGGTMKRAASQASRLRRRLGGVGLDVVTVRGRGLVLDHALPRPGRTGATP